MSEESNNNFEFARSHQIFKQRLNPIYEDKYMESSFIPDIQLECDEIIDDWDDIDSRQIYKLHYSEVGISSLHSLDHQALITDNMYLDYEPPDTPLTGLANKACQNSYVNSFLEQKLEDYQESSSGTCMDESDDFSLPSGDVSSESSDHCDGTKESHSNEYFQENEANFDSGRSAAGFMDANNSQLALNESISQQSSRSVSPVIQNIFQTDWHEVSFENLRSVSPHILRSLSPISSQSSSPRFFRSLSPLDDMQELQQSLLMDDSALVFYENGYVRSHSPLSTGLEHQVPDVDLELQSVAYSLEEIPSFINHAYRRRHNSCQDQVVPEFIAE